MILNQFLDYLIKLGQVEAAERLRNKTAAEWIACGANFKDIEDNNPSNWMIEAFDWNKTAEGYDYWSDICDNVERDYYRNLEKERLRVQFGLEDKEEAPNPVPNPFL